MGMTLMALNPSSKMPGAPDDGYDADGEITIPIPHKASVRELSAVNPPSTHFRPMSDRCIRNVLQAD